MARRKYIETLEAVGYTGITETVTAARAEGDTIVCTVELTASRTVIVAAAHQNGAKHKTTKAERKAAIRSALEAANGKSK